MAGAWRRTGGDELFTVQELGPELVVGGVQVDVEVVIVQCIRKFVC